MQLMISPTVSKPLTSDNVRTRAALATGTSGPQRVGLLTFAEMNIDCQTYWYSGGHSMINGASPATSGVALTSASAWPAAAANMGKAMGRVGNLGALC